MRPCLRSDVLVVILSLLIAGLAGAWPAAGQQPAGGEFQINGFTPGRQSEPAIARSAAGDFIVVWSSGCSPIGTCTTQDGDGLGVFGRRYDASGNALGLFEFQVNTYTTADQRDAAVAAGPEGDFVVVWKSWGQIGPWEDIIGRRYDASGSPVGGEFQVSTITSTRQNRPAVASDDAGNFVVVWTGDIGGNLDILARRFDASGTPAGDEFRVNSFTTGTQTSADVAMEPDGDFVVTWTRQGSGPGVFAQRFDAAGGRLGGEFRVHENAVGGERDSAVASDATGNWVSTWTNSANSGDVYARRFDASGAPVGDEFRVNTYTTNSQQLSDVAVDADGDFVVTWYSYGQDGSSGGIFAQEYEPDGTPRGNEFQVNTYTFIHQLVPAVGVDGDGDATIVWQSYTPNLTHDILGQRYAGPGLFLSVSGFCPGTVQATVLNGPPNTEVAVVAAANDDGFVKGGTLCPGTEFTIGEPFQMPPALVILDGDGNGSTSLNLAAGRCWVQALAFSGCQTSDTVRVP